MNKLNSDKYEFVYPNYSFSKAIDLENDLIESLDFPQLEIKKIFYKYI